MVRFKTTHFININNLAILAIELLFVNTVLTVQCWFYIGCGKSSYYFGNYVLVVINVILILITLLFACRPILPLVRVCQGMGRVYRPTSRADFKPLL